MLHPKSLLIYTQKQFVRDHDIMSAVNDAIPSENNVPPEFFLYGLVQDYLIDGASTDSSVDSSGLSPSAIYAEWPPTTYGPPLSWSKDNDKIYVDQLKARRADPEEKSFDMKGKAIKQMIQPLETAIDQDAVNKLNEILQTFLERFASSKQGKYSSWATDIILTELND